MSELRFDERVVVVTGAGRGIGRAYAHLLADRGAKVMVNDLGASIGGDGVEAGPAATVVGEIEAAGGEAVANTDDVSTAEGGSAIVGTAIERWGRIDAVINNAGIVRWAGMPEVDLENLERHLAVHVGGAFNTTRAAWPHMADAGYGRIVLTGSAGMFGLPTNTSYAAAKAAMIGLANSLTLAGARRGIRTNVIAPAAMTRMAGTDDTAADVDPSDPMAPDHVAPMAAFLAHEDCPVSGEVFAAGAGRFTRIFVAETDGWVAGSGAPTLEDVAANWDAITDPSGYRIPADLPGWSADFLRHLEVSD